MQVLAALRYELADEFDFDYVGGCYPWPPATGIAETFGTSQLCYSYFDGSAQSVVATINDLGSYLVENGPFDIVIGFSLGAALTASLLLQPCLEENVMGQIKSALFICGSLPCDWNQLQRGEVALLEAEGVGRVIQTPTVHAWSLQDVEHSEQSKKLVRMCGERTRIEVIHSAGHNVPSLREEVLAVANAVRQVVVHGNKRD